MEGDQGIETSDRIIVNIPDSPSNPVDKSNAQSGQSDNATGARPKSGCMGRQGYMLSVSATTMF